MGLSESRAEGKIPLGMLCSQHRREETYAVVGLSAMQPMPSSRERTCLTAKGIGESDPTVSIGRTPKESRQRVVAADATVSFVFSYSTTICLIVAAVCERNDCS